MSKGLAILAESAQVRCAAFVVKDDFIGARLDDQEACSTGECHSDGFKPEA
jgi:hypothetical protein